MLVPILQSIVGVVLVLLGIDTAKTPPTTRSMLWLYRGMFITLGLSMVALGWIQFRNERREQESSLAQLRELKYSAAATPAPAVPEKTRPVPTPDTNQINYQKKYSDLLSDLISNSNLDPDLRERLIIAKTQMTRESTGNRETLGGPELASAQAAREKILPYFDYGIKTLAAISEETGRVKSDQSELSYIGLPKEVSPEALAGRRSRLSVAAVKFHTNADWDFRVDMIESASPHYEANLTVTCTGGFLLLKSTRGGIETKVETTRGESFSHKATTGTEAKNNIADAMGKLVASELEAVSSKK